MWDEIRKTKQIVEAAASAKFNLINNCIFFVPRSDENINKNIYNDIVSTGKLY